MFDSSFPFAVGERRLLRRATPFSLLTFDFSRIPSIMEERATTYQTLFFQSLQIEGVFPDRHTITVVGLRHTDAKWAACCLRSATASFSSPRPRSWSTSTAAGFSSS